VDGHFVNLQQKKAKNLKIKTHRTHRTTQNHSTAVVLEQCFQTPLLFFCEIVNKWKKLGEWSVCEPQTEKNEVS